MRSIPKNLPQSLKLFFIALGALVVGTLFMMIGHTSPSQINAQHYESLRSEGHIVSAILQGDEIRVLTDQGVTYAIPKEAIDLKALFERVPLQIDTSMGWDEWLMTIVFMMAALFMMMVFWRSRQMGKATPSPQTLSATNDPTTSTIQPSHSTITFRDVAGIEEVKGELRDIIDFLANPKKYTDFGARVPKGVILAGPPGVGKTMVARAVAGEAGVPFFYQSGSSFVQIFVGVGPKRVRELFAQAKKHAPSIIFIDEIDAVGKSRGEGRNDEREATLNQLLTEMDGFEENTGVIVIAATNKIEMLDDALLRPGRFDRRVFLSLPTVSEREAIVKLYLARVPHDVHYDMIAKMSVGFSAAAMANFVNEATLLAIKEGTQRVITDHFIAVRDKVFLGTKKVVSLSDDEKHIVSLYQAAKGWFAYYCGWRFEKVTLMNESKTHFDHEIVTQDDLLRQISYHIVGTCAVESFLGVKITYAQEDLKEARTIARAMTERFGMGALLTFQEGEDATILQNLYEQIHTLILAHRRQIENLSNLLEAKESLCFDDFCQSATL